MYTRSSIRAVLAIVAFAAICGSASPDRKAQAQLLCESAEQCYRRSEFGRAREIFSIALAHDPDLVAAQLGLVRMDLLESYRKRAWDRVQQLAQTRPGDAQVASAQHLLTELQLAAHDKLLSPYQHYSIPLRIDQRGADPQGAYVIASVNGSKPLRLLVDTGASRILLNPRAAASLNLQPLQTSSISGYVDGSQPAKIALARTLRLGDLEFGDVRIYVSNTSFENGIDGLIGTRLFRQFLLKLNVSAKRLDLEPFENVRLAGPNTDSAWMDCDRERVWEERGFEPLYQLGHYLLVNGRLTRDRSGVFLLDTGSSFSALGEETSGEERSHLFSPLRFRRDGSSIRNEAPRLNLKPWSARNGVRLDGVLGFPAIRFGVLTLNYRDGYWKLSD